MKNTLRNMIAGTVLGGALMVGGGCSEEASYEPVGVESEERPYNERDFEEEVPNTNDSAREGNYIGKNIAIPLIEASIKGACRVLRFADDCSGSSNKYGYEDFKKVLGERIISEKESELNDFWNSFNEQDKILIYRAFRDKESPEEYFAEHRKSLPESFLKGYKDFRLKIGNISFNEFCKIREDLCWDFDFEKDALGLYVSRGLSFKYNNSPLF